MQTTANLGCHDLARGLPGAGCGAPGRSGDPEGAGRQRDAAVGVPQAGRQPSWHVPAGIRGERAVLVAVVVHRRGRPVGVHGPRRRGGVAGRDAAGRAERRRSGARAARDVGAAADRTRARAAAAVRRTRRILRLRPGAPAGKAARTGRRRPRAARHPAAAGHRHRRGRPPRGHHHADRQRGELERHRRTRRLGLRRRRLAAGRDDRGARHEPVVDGGDLQPARAAEPPTAHGRGVRRDRRAARRRDRGGRGIPGGAVAAVRDGHRRRTRSTCTGCCGCPTPARTCIC